MPLTFQLRMNVNFFQDFYKTSYVYCNNVPSCPAVCNTDNAYVEIIDYNVANCEWLIANKALWWIFALYYIGVNDILVLN